MAGITLSFDHDVSPVDFAHAASLLQIRGHGVFDARLAKEGRVCDLFVHIVTSPTANPSDLEERVSKLAVVGAAEVFVVYLRDDLEEDYPHRYSWGHSDLNGVYLSILRRLDALWADQVHEIAFRLPENCLARRFVSRYSEEKQEEIKKEAADFIDPTLKNLDSEKNLYRVYALISYGVAVALLGTGAVLYYFLTTQASESGRETGWTFASTMLRAVILVGFLSALAKLACDIGKNFMNESFRSAERRHAIQFGKFYLAAYGDLATREEVREVFSQWNIDRQSGFAILNSSEYDPKPCETVASVMKASIKK